MSSDTATLILADHVGDAVVADWLARDGWTRVPDGWHRPGRSIRLIDHTEFRRIDLDGDAVTEVAARIARDLPVWTVDDLAARLDHREGPDAMIWAVRRLGALPFTQRHRRTSEAWQRAAHHPDPRVRIETARAMRLRTPNRLRSMAAAVLDEDPDPEARAEWQRTVDALEPFDRPPIDAPPAPDDDLPF